jgi:cytoskeletal protein CcmA (bactofilin family)
MLRMGRNQKTTEQPSADADATADFTPQQQSSTPASSPSYNTGYNNSSSTTPAYGSSSQTSAGSSANYGSSAAGATPAGQSSASRAVTESESLARDIKEGNLSGFVGAGTSVSGEATFQMMLRVDGHLSGRVSSGDGTLIVSAGGQVDADVAVAVALINGTVNGDIVATKRIELGRVARVNGNIQTPALVVENGALFEGGCRMTQVREAQETVTAPAYEESRSTNDSYTSASSTPLTTIGDEPELSRAADAD